VVKLKKRLQCASLDDIQLTDVQMLTQYMM